METLKDALIALLRFIVCTLLLYRSNFAYSCHVLYEAEHFLKSCFEMEFTKT